MNKRLSSLHRLALCTVSSILVLHSAVSYADDTEIFFGGAAIDDSVRPNVLFVLDNSGSMAWRTDSNSNPSGSQQSRMQILKDSFSTIINNAGAINAGIMVLNSRSAYNNTRMVYPVSNIDDPLPSSVQLVASTPVIRASGDDATQSSLSSNAVINATSLVMGNISTPIMVGTTNTNTLKNNGAYYLTSTGYACALNPSALSPVAGRPSTNCPNNSAISEVNLRSNNTGRTALFHFRGISQPADRTITSAYLELTPTNSQNNNNRPTLNLYIENAKSPAALDDSGLLSPAGNVRNFISSQETASSWQNGGTAQFDITSELRDLLDNDADPIGDLVMHFRAQQNRDYTFAAQGGTATVMPRIVINYDNPSTQIEARKGGLRFQDVGIPQGATITEAYLSFTPASSNSDAVRFEVKAEKVADAAIFTGTTNLNTRLTTTAMTTWDAPAWSTSSPPVEVQGPDVRALVQEVVSLPTWCGNNSMAFYLNPTSGVGTRTAHSIDGAPGLQPTLTVTYTGGETGCINPILEATVNNPKNDAYEESDDDMVLGGDTLPVDQSRFAARFEGVPLVNGATILDTQVIFTPANTVPTANVTTTVRFENADNSAPFTATDDDITDRNDTTDSSCTFNSWVASTPVTCSNATLRSGLQSVVNRGGWSPGNALTVMSVQGSNSALEVQAYESNPAEAIKLRIKVANGGLASSTYTVRNHLNALVQAMNASDGTPIVPTMNEAARYLRGERAGYSSPITSACQSTHLVVLTDGQANGNGAQSSIGTLTGSSCTGDASLSDEQCGRRLATWMATTDQSSIADDNFITTHTIGFALGALAPNTGPQTFLTDMANNGKGKAYTAENASELSAAFSKILQDVLSTDTTFVSPGATVNQFNRQSNKNEVYFALFKPSETNSWVGNLKRYGLSSSSGDIIIDADNVGAIDANTGFFKSTARSFWTSGSDGNNTALGGVANKLPAYATRKVYTYTGNSPAAAVALNAGAYLLNDANSNVTQAMLGASSTTERTSLINWIRGRNDDGSQRNAIGDPLHSVPRLVTYECSSFTDSTLTACASEKQSVFVGTNEGFIHAFNTNTGVEQMAFMPEALLGNIKALKANEESTTLAPRKYGMDNTVVTWVNDVNGNGVIYGGRDPSNPVPTLLPSGLNSGEFVYAYATMGRGGRNLYSLDVTDIDNPKMRWFITPSTPGFAKLGQTWSTPVVTKIDINGTSTPVLMFAGGYDETQDDISILNQNKDGSARTQDSQGNAIYIVNALTGALIWSGSNEATNVSAQAHQQLSKMLYSMPSSLRAIDINRDGYADQFFVGDMGGQIWRFFINNGNSASSLISPLDSGAGTTGDGVFANVIPANAGGETTAELKGKLRRFYNEPDIALLTVNAGKSLVVSIGSGYRGHPLDTGADDRFYSFRTPIIDSNAAHTVITEDEMYDATLNLVQEGSAAQQAAAATQFAKNSGGWYIRLENEGEKVLAESTTFAGKVFFNTYEPNASAANNSCKAVQGVGRAYAVNLFDATPITQMVSGTADRADRSRELLTAGIPPKGITLFPEGSDNPPLCIGTECEELDVDITVGPTYWIDEL
ncbi:pilus assembly protein [Aquipseudomonas guryensis]|jgi:type IV pilus assembly protein PilY1|uniref:Pilus assembly protein PilY n=1 Tax=Aquipseudomonas guryensis TaxID=2759165 RepID=A0A7W4D8F8_9GAMM|nr:PilC/PilY family type IV pilus protein [Pseudomonas guryensis]MBB1517919.1 pilus assembly protein PilY [Pseudomonas guryensis]